MRVLIYGGRDFADSETAMSVLDYVLADWKPDDGLVVVSGGARGADSIGEFWAETRGHTVEQFPAQWKLHGKAAGAIRNQQMLDSGIDYAVQFPGGNGTADMRRRLDKAGIQVWEYKN